MLDSNRDHPPKLLTQLRERLRFLHYSIRTEQQYVQWVRRFVLFHGGRHPSSTDVTKIEGLSTSSAVEGGVAVLAHNPALGDESGMLRIV